MPESTGQVLAERYCDAHKSWEIVVQLEKLDMMPDHDPQDYTWAQNHDVYPCVCWLDGEYDLIEEEIR